MKTSISILILFISVVTVNAQDYLSEFNELIQSRDTLKQKELLDKWQNETPKDAELHTCLFNYYFNKSRNEIISINRGKPKKGEKALLFKDSTNQIAGYIGSYIDYDQSNLKNAFESIDKGIELHPNRLDMRFGKIYALGQVRDWRSFTDEIIKTVDYSVVNDNQWTWTYDKKHDGGSKEFLTSVQDYQAQLYNTMNNALLVNMQEIAKAVLRYYPNHIESLSNLSIAYLIEKKFNKALKPLLKAEKLNPEDFIVLTNIAYAYKESGDKKNAIIYYKKVLKYGDQQAKETAEVELKQLEE